MIGKHQREINLFAATCHYSDVPTDDSFGQNATLAVYR